jgi:hypothetical protein
VVSAHIAHRFEKTTPRTAIVEELELTAINNGIGKPPTRLDEAENLRPPSENALLLMRRSGRIHDGWYYFRAPRVAPGERELQKLTSYCGPTSSTGDASAAREEAGEAYAP